MLNSKGNEKKTRPSCQENKTIIVGLEVMERIKDEVKKTFELNAKGKLAKEVSFEEYVVIKAYDNKDLNKSGKVAKSNKKDTTQLEVGE